MILKALDTLHISSVSSNNILAGQSFELDDHFGRQLIERGLAVEVAARPAARPAAPEIAGEDLARALEAGEIFVVFQPILHLDSLDPVGAEALVRWRHPERGVVPPGLSCRSPSAQDWCSR